MEFDLFLKGAAIETITKVEKISMIVWKVRDKHVKRHAFYIKDI